MFHNRVVVDTDIQSSFSTFFTDNSDIFQVNGVGLGGNWPTQGTDETKLTYRNLWG